PRALCGVVSLLTRVPLPRLLLVAVRDLPLGQLVRLAGSVPLPHGPPGQRGTGGRDDDREQERPERDGRAARAAGGARGEEEQGAADARADRERPAQPPLRGPLGLVDAARQVVRQRLPPRRRFGERPQEPPAVAE